MDLLSHISGCETFFEEWTGSLFGHGNWQNTMLFEALMLLGWLSYERPAGDIFVAGTTQALPTILLAGRFVIHKWYRRMANAPFVALVVKMHRLIIPPFNPGTPIPKHGINI